VDVLPPLIESSLNGNPLLSPPFPPPSLSERGPVVEGSGLDPQLANLFASLPLFLRLEQRLPPPTTRQIAVSAGFPSNGETPRSPTPMQSIRSVQLLFSRRHPVLGPPEGSSCSRSLAPIGGQTIRLEPRFQRLILTPPSTAPPIPKGPSMLHHVSFSCVQNHLPV